MAEEFPAPDREEAPPESPEEEARADDGDEESPGLFDPDTLPPELQPHWSRMERAYQQRLERVKSRENTQQELERKAQLVDRFYSDPAYAQEIIAARARQLGQPPSAGTPPSGSAPSVPATVLQATQAALPEDLQFLAPALAQAQWASAQEATRPLHEERRQSAQEQRQAEIDRLASELETRAPDWGNYEDEMTERWHFLQAALAGRGPLSHPRYGSVMELLYTWATGNSRATADAGRRMEQAVRNRTRAGTGTSSRAPDVVSQIQATSDPQQKWELAWNAAMAAAQRGRR